MIKIEDTAIFHKDAKNEFNYPLPEKQLDDRTIYLSRNNYGPLSKPTGTIQLVDFDRAVHTTPGDLHTGAIQTEIYRAPEVIVNSGYTFSADIWSLGVLVILPFSRLMTHWLILCLDSCTSCSKGKAFSALRTVIYMMI